MLHFFTWGAELLACSLSCISSGSSTSQPSSRAISSIVFLYAPPCSLRHVPLTAIKCSRCSQHSNASHTRLKVGVVALKVARQHAHAEGAVLGRELWGADGGAQGLVALAGGLEGIGVWGLGFRV